MGRRTITQSEIAKQLNVSVATVSRVLNDQPGVSPDVRQRIQQAMKELSYSPDIRARSLATSVTHTVAFVVHQDHSTAQDPFYPVIMAGAEAYLSQHGYHILLSTVNDQILAGSEELAVINECRVDGLILAGPDISPSFILNLLAADIPVALVDNSLPHTPVNCVLNDDEGGAYAATHCLLEHGHTRIVFLSGPQQWVSNRERLRGYGRAMEEAGIESLSLQGTETTVDSGRKLMAEALNRWPDLTAICAVNDAVAIGAIRTATEAGRRTPADVSVVGFDDITWAQMNEPPLTTVHVFKHRMGEMAAQCLLGRIQSPEAAPLKIVVATQLVLRNSCCNRINQTGR